MVLLLAEATLFLEFVVSILVSFTDGTTTLMDIILAAVVLGIGLVLAVRMRHMFI